VSRADGRAPGELRPVRITPGYLAFADGSAMIELGQTRVLCAVSVEERLPAFLRGQGSGWITAEYSMLPRATPTRTPRESGLIRPGGRSQEIQRLIGRSLRAAIDLVALGERTLTIDCDVIQADGGTRTAAITGGYVALILALRRLAEKGALPRVPVLFAVAATSVGIVDGQPLLDLCYAEDARAEVDFNAVMTDQGEFVEVQGTAEGASFSRQTMDALLDLAGRPRTLAPAFSLSPRSSRPSATARDAYGAAGDSLTGAVGTAVGETGVFAGVGVRVGRRGVLVGAGAVGVGVFAGGGGGGVAVVVGGKGAGVPVGCGAGVLVGASVGAGEGVNAGAVVGGYVGRGRGVNTTGGDVGMMMGSCVGKSVAVGVGSRLRRSPTFTARANEPPA